MTALAEDRNTHKREGKVISLPVAASTICFGGGLAAVNATGYAVPGSTSTALKAAGRFNQRIDNSAGADGALNVEIERGVFKFANSGGDPIAQADVLADCYIEDDQTVAKTDGTGTRSKAGKILSVESDGIYVEIK